MVTDIKGKERLKRETCQGHHLQTFKEKIFAPKEARAPMVEWYHERLQHTGSKRTARTIRKHFE